MLKSRLQKLDGLTHVKLKENIKCHKQNTNRKVLKVLKIKLFK